MADIFLSYTSEDVDRAKPLVRILEQQGWSIWWDHNIKPGKAFDQVVEDEIATARCLVVLWSNKSVQSDWVKSEADEGQKRKILIPAMIDNVVIPLGFRRTQAARLYDWRVDDLCHPQLKLLLVSIEEVLQRSSTDTIHTVAAPLVPETGITNQKRPENADKNHRSLSLKQAKVVAITISSVIGLALIATILIWQTKVANNDADKSNTAGTKSNPVILTPTDLFRSDMVAIPGGTFMMGRNDGPITEAPAHSVVVAPFFIDRTEVTNLEYAAFIRDMKYPQPLGWSDNKPTPGQEQWPVSNVSVDDANAFAAWRAKRDNLPYRLPSEEEWEYAARSGDRNFRYPWGNQWTGDRANVGNESMTRVGSYPEGKNRWGVLDLIGNVWEWTSTSASLYPEADINQVPKEIRMPFEQRGWVIARGGSFATAKSAERATSAATRDWFESNYKNAVLGFRLARSK